MSIDEARAAIGRKVIYRPDGPELAVEEGVITSVSKMYVFVRYGSDTASMATHPRNLTLLPARADIPAGETQGRGERRDH